MSNVSIDVSNAPPQWLIYNYILGVLVSVIDSFRAIELFCLVLLSVDGKFFASTSKTVAALMVGSFQIDSGLIDSIDSVILCPTFPHPTPAMSFKVEKDNIRSEKNVDSYTFVRVQFKELDISIEEVWLNSTWRFYAELEHLLDSWYNSDSIAGKKNADEISFKHKVFI